MVRLGRTIAFYQVFFQQSRVAFGKWCIGPKKGRLRSPGMDSFCTVPRPYFLGRALIWPGCFGEHILALWRSVWIISFEFVKVCGIRFSIWESFIGFYICCYPTSTMLACLFPLEFEFRGKRCVEWEHVGENGISCPLPCILGYLKDSNAAGHSVDTGIS